MLASCISVAWKGRAIIILTAWVMDANNPYSYLGIIFCTAAMKNQHEKLEIGATPPYLYPKH